MKMSSEDIGSTFHEKIHMIFCFNKIDKLEALSIYACFWKSLYVRRNLTRPHLWSEPFLVFVFPVDEAVPQEVVVGWLVTFELQLLVKAQQ